MLNLLRNATLVALLAAAAGPAGAQDADYPSERITAVVGYAPGGPTDVFMRALGQRLEEAWGQPVVVENRTGASEMIAAQRVAVARPDGYTLLMSTEVPLTIAPHLMKQMQYDPEEDFAPVSLVLTSSMALAVPASFPANTLEEFIALAKERAAAGTPLAYGSAGPGSGLHLPMAVLADENGLEITHVPYQGLAPLLTDLVSEKIDVTWGAAAAIAPFVNDGRLKALVITAPSRLPILPDVPIFSETTVSPVQADFLFVLNAPAGTPAVITEKISAQVRKIVDDPDFREKHVDPYGFVVVGSTPSELDAYLREDSKRQAKRVAVSGVEKR